MPTLFFKFACRECNTTSGIDGSISDWENNLDYYKNLTDYEVSQQIEKTMKNNEINCEFCGANNWDIGDIRADNYKLFNINTINNIYAKKDSFVFEFELTTINGSGSHVTHNSTNPDLVRGFGKALFEHRCKTEIKEIINSIPTSKCTNHQDAYFYFFFTGNKTEIKLESLRHIGISKRNMIYMIDNSLMSCDESMWEIGY